MSGVLGEHGERVSSSHSAKRKIRAALVGVYVTRNSDPVVWLMAKMSFPPEHFAVSGIVFCCRKSTLFLLSRVVTRKDAE